MKIRDIITEGTARQKAPTTGNDAAKIARSSKIAKQMFKDADKGHQMRTDDVGHLLAHVRAMYGVEIVDDWVDILEKPNGEHDTDKEQSLISKDMRK